MKLVAAPAAVQAELRARRERFTPGIDNPPDGELWYLAPGACNVCGRTNDELSACVGDDHCHATGLFRGNLCGGCNVAEGRAKNSALWPFWRRNAPGLENPTQHDIGNPYNTPASAFPACFLSLFSVDHLVTAYESVIAERPDLKPRTPSYFACGYEAAFIAALPWHLDERGRMNARAQAAS